MKLPVRSSLASDSQPASPSTRVRLFRARLTYSSRFSLPRCSAPRQRAAVRAPLLAAPMRASTLFCKYRMRSWLHAVPSSGPTASRCCPCSATSCAVLRALSPRARARARLQRRHQAAVVLRAPPQKLSGDAARRQGLARHPDRAQHIRCAADLRRRQQAEVCELLTGGQDGVRMEVGGDEICGSIMRARRGHEVADPRRRRGRAAGPAAYSA